MTPRSSLPVAAGIGLRLPHIRQVLAERPSVAWFEVHPENYFGGGPNLAALTALRADYPLSLHGVGMGLGSAVEPDPDHLAAFRRLIERLEPASVSEHLCWNRTERECFNDLLPLPYTEAALDLLCRRVTQVQEALGRRLLIENLSSYVAFAADAIPEGEFLAELARRSGCGLLVDINNLWVNQLNLGRDARAALAALPAQAVGELHVAGFEHRDDGLVLDTHGTPVAPEVWALLDEAYRRFGPVATLLERDTNLPPFAELQDEAASIQTVLERAREPRT